MYDDDSYGDYLLDESDAAATSFSPQQSYAFTSLAVHASSDYLTSVSAANDMTRTVALADYAYPAPPQIALANNAYDTGSPAERVPRTRCLAESQTDTGQEVITGYTPQLPGQSEQTRMFSFPGQDMPMQVDSAHQMSFAGDNSLYYSWPADFSQVVRHPLLHLQQTPTATQSASSYQLFGERQELAFHVEPPSAVPKYTSTVVQAHWGGPFTPHHVTPPTGEASVIPVLIQHKSLPAPIEYTANSNHTAAYSPSGYSASHWPEDSVSRSMEYSTSQDFALHNQGQETYPTTHRELNPVDKYSSSSPKFSYAPTSSLSKAMQAMQHPATPDPSMYSSSQASSPPAPTSLRFQATAIPSSGYISVYTSSASFPQTMESLISQDPELYSQGPAMSSPEPIEYASATNPSYVYSTSSCTALQAAPASVVEPAQPRISEERTLHYDPAISFPVQSPPEGHLPSGYPSCHQSQAPFAETVEFSNSQHVRMRCESPQVPSIVTSDCPFPISPREGEPSIPLWSNDNMDFLPPPPHLLPSYPAEPIPNPAYAIYMEEMRAAYRPAQDNYVPTSPTKIRSATLLTAPLAARLRGPKSGGTSAVTVNTSCENSTRYLSEVSPEEWSCEDEDVTLIQEYVPEDGSRSAGHTVIVFNDGRKRGKKVMKRPHIACFHCKYRRIKCDDKVYDSSGRPYCEPCIERGGPCHWPQKYHPYLTADFYAARRRAGITGLVSCYNPAECPKRTSWTYWTDVTTGRKQFDDKPPGDGAPKKNKRRALDEHWWDFWATPKYAPKPRKSPVPRPTKMKFVHYRGVRPSPKVAKSKAVT